MKNRSTVDQILDLLLDALQERQAEREETTSEQPAPITEPTPPPAVEPTPDPDPTPHEWQLTDWTQTTEPPAQETTSAAAPESTPPPTRRETIHLGRMLGRLALAVILLTLLINIPFNRHGTTLARAMPDEAALIVRDGLLLKGNGDEVYVLENNQLRWITTLDAFEYYGYRWENVHQVEDRFIARFEPGRPVHLLVKCPDSPHVYALENGQKRWIKDIPTFETLGVPWDDIQIRNCASLRNLPDGIPIPADAGEPPQP